MLDTNISYQLSTFFFSVISGVCMGAFYTVLKCIRYVFKNRFATVVCDFIFMITFAVVTFLFSVGYCDGYVRYYVFFGELLGVFLFVFTIGRLVFLLFAATSDIIRKCCGAIQKNLKQIAKKLLKASNNMLYNIKNKSNIHMDS